MTAPKTAMFSRAPPTAPLLPDQEIDTRANHMALAVDDFAEVEQKLATLGIRYHKQVNAGGIPQIFFHDPDGHHIELGIYPPTPREV